MPSRLGAVSQVMNTEVLETNLQQFTGTEDYYRIAPNLVITDGVQYLANEANCYWLLTAIYSHLPKASQSSEFVVARLVVWGSRAELTLDDGNGNVLVTQKIGYTDFPLPEMKLYCIKQESNWVALLPSEY